MTQMVYLKQKVFKYINININIFHKKWILHKVGT